MTYDFAGRKTSLNDPDKGYWQYAYNALGEMSRQLDSKGQAVDFSYDVLGRITYRRERKDVASLTDSVHVTVNRESTTYITNSIGKGQVGTVIYRRGEAGTELQRKVISYDGFGRVDITSTTIDGNAYAEQATYDQYSRLFQQFDASGDDRGLRYVYSNGYLSQLKEARDGTSGIVYQDIEAMDARGNVTLMQLGNGVSVHASYEQNSGRLLTLSAFDAMGVELQDVDYIFDVLGNLKHRHDQSAGNNLKEIFGYDTLSRLKNVGLSVNGAASVQTLSLNYDSSGNITFKSDVGSYLYNGSQPHAVSSVGIISYNYDSNGNQISGDGRNITYTVFDKPDSISKGNTLVEFSYGVSNNRYQRKDYEGGILQKSTLYLGSTERITENGSTSFKRYLGGIAIATYYPSTGIQQFSYLLKDHIGSIHTVLNDSGLITATMHFDAFGQRQDSNWQTPLTSFLYTSLNDITTRGFTGHEQVDSVGIVHMNGRIYDPKLGRFLQADPVVQAPKNSQSLNRYSYVLNNPLSYTDPSGYFSLGRFIKKWGRLIVAVAVSYVTYGAASGWAAGWLAGSALAGNTIAIGAIAGSISGFVGGAIVSSSINGAVRGAFSGAIMGGVAGYFGNSYSVNRIAADSLAAGIAAEIYGQRFKDGLLFGALISSATFITVRLRAYQKAQSKKFPGQVGKSKGFRGISGKLAGERTFEQNWVDSGAARAYSEGKSMEWVLENKYVPFRKHLSPLGGLQGGDGLLFGKVYRSGGLVDYTVEGFSGVHDTLNQPFFYSTNGTNRLLTSPWQKALGYIVNPANVLLATPIVLPALVPDYIRHFYFQDYE